MVLAASLPSSPRISVSTTMTRLPMCNGWLCALTVPERVAAKKLVLDSMVAVPPAPWGRFRNAHTAPDESASAITIPPCSTSLPVHRFGAQSRLSTTSFGPAVSAVMPSVTHSGTSEWIISVAAVAVTCSASHCLQRLRGGRGGRGRGAGVGEHLAEQCAHPWVGGARALAVHPFEDMCPPLRQIDDAG